MPWSEIFINIFSTMVIGWLIMWSFIAWGFGISNFRETHNKLLGDIGLILWFALVFGHLYAIYLLWATSTSIGSIGLSLFLAHVFYGSTFATNVSRR
jgi:hypothetical protein